MGVESAHELGVLGNCRSVARLIGTAKAALEMIGALSIGVAREVGGVIVAGVTGAQDWTTSMLTGVLGGLPKCT